MTGATELTEAAQHDSPGFVHHVFELTDEIVESVLPGQAEDIRGRIHGQPERVFAIVDGERVSYTGITAR